MGWNGTGITAPVSIYSLRQCFSTNKASIGDIIAFEDINKWAKYKPQRESLLGSIDAYRKRDYYGLDVPWISNNGDVTVIAKKVMYNENPQSITFGDWGYLRPRGQADQGHGNEHYRFSDFSGYNHKAVQPFFVELQTSLTWVSEETSSTHKDKGHYEVNVGTLDEITFIIRNNNRDNRELTFQDFLYDETVDDYYRYRFVVELYEGTQDAWTNQVGIYVSDILANLSGSFTTVSIDTDDFELPSSQGSTFPVVYYYAFAYILKCKADGTINVINNNYQTGDHIGFLPIWTTSQKNRGRFPFYYKFEVSNHMDDMFTLKFVGYKSSSSIVQLSMDLCYVVPSGTYGALCIKIDFSRSMTVDYEFVAQNSTEDSGYTPIKMYLMKDGDTSTEYWMTPCTSSGQVTDRVRSTHITSSDMSPTPFYAISDSSPNAINVGSASESGDSYAIYAVIGNHPATLVERFTIRKG